MTPAALLTLTAGACLLLASSQARASVEAGEEGVLAMPSFSLDNVTDRLDTFYNLVTEIPAKNDMNAALQNIIAFQSMIQFAEGTLRQANPYATCYGYRHTIASLADHPAITGEWRGERLPDAMCANAGFGPGCVSTAAGAYQIIKPTWLRVKNKLGLRDFSRASQDAAAVELIASRGALEDVKAGRIIQAITKCKNEWASLPGNYARQGQRSMGDLIAAYQDNGGYTA